MGHFSGWGKGNINLADNYVFYQHLKDNPIKWYQSLYSTMSKRLDNMVSTNIPKPNSQAIQNLKQMAIEERKREQAFINNAFKVNLNLSLDATNTKDFIDTFNAYMQLDKVYDMRKSLLLHNFNSEDGQNLKDAYSFFTSYLADTFSRSSSYKKQIVNLILTAASEQDAETKINNYINQIMPTMVQKSLDKLQKAKANKSKNLSEAERQQIQEGLRAINDSINQLGKTRFGRQIISQLGLSNFSKLVAGKASQLYQQKTNSDLSKKLNKVIKESNAYLKSQVNISGGIMLELTESAALKVIAKELQGKHVRIEYSGGTGMKADNIMIVMEKPIPTQVDEVFEELAQTQTSRKSNIEAIEKLERILGANGDNGFIIYFSDKNHFMNAIDKDAKGKSIGKTLRGFEGGTPQSLKNFEPVLSKANGLNTGVSVGLIIQSIMQTLSGAIGEGRKEEIRSWLATLFAYFLFDDVGNIGTSIKGSTLTALHIMNLNGVYIPLSVILDRFAAALEKSITQGMSSPSSFVRATISAPKIKYNYDEDTEIPKDAWQQQRTEAYENTKVGIKFLKNVRELVAGYLDQI